MENIGFAIRLILWLATLASMLWATIYITEVIIGGVQILLEKGKTK